MELTEVLAGQYAFHGLIAGLVLTLAVLVFAFGFKSAQEPPFDKLTSEDRRTPGKKRKIKEKKSPQNGHATAVADGKKEPKTPKKEEKKEGEKSPKKASKEEPKPPLKNTLKETKRNNENLNELKEKTKKKGKENVEIKTKKNKIVEEKPKDFDDGEWEQALSRKDKKNRKTALEEIQLKSGKKKEKKKAKEDKPLTPEPYEPEPQEIVPEPETPVKQKVEIAEVEAQPETVAEEKPKKSKKKKQAPEPPQKIEAIPPQKEEKPKRDPTPPPKPVEKAAVVEVAPLTASELDSSLAFDELGDTWKEARAPKKSNKKKSRKD